MKKVGRVVGPPLHIQLSFGRRCPLHDLFCLARNVLLHKLARNTRLQSHLEKKISRDLLFKAKCSFP